MKHTHPTPISDAIGNLVKAIRDQTLGLSELPISRLVLDVPVYEKLEKESVYLPSNVTVRTQSLCVHTVRVTRNDTTPGAVKDVENPIGEQP